MEKHSRDLYGERQKNLGRNMSENRETGPVGVGEPGDSPVNTSVENRSEDSSTGAEPSLDTYTIPVENFKEDPAESEDAPEPEAGLVGEDLESVEDVSATKEEESSSSVHEVKSTITGVKAEPGEQFHPIRIPVNAPNLMALAGLNSETGADSIGAYLIYKRSVKLADAVGILALVGILAAVMAEMFTYTVYSVYKMSTVSTIIIGAFLVMYWLMQRTLIDTRVDNILTGKRSIVSVVLGWASTLSLVIGSGLIVWIFIDLWSNNPDVFNAGGAGYGGYINDYSLWNSAPAGALIQSLPIVIYTMAAITGIVSAVKFLSGRRKLVNEFDTMQDFKSLYKNGEAYIVEG